MRARNCDVCGNPPVIQRRGIDWDIHCEGEAHCTFRFLYSNRPKAQAIKVWNDMIAKFKADDRRAA